MHWLSLTALSMTTIFAVAAADAGRQSLRTPGARFVIDAQSGRLLSIDNRLTDTTHTVTRDGGRLKLADTAVDFGALDWAPGDEALAFRASAGPLAIERAYSVPEGRDYLLRTTTLVNTSDRDVVVGEVTDCVLYFADAFRDVHYHDDSMDRMDPGTEVFYEMDEPAIYQAALNVFLRAEAGGLLAGITYPYWKPLLTQHSATLAYEANMRIKPGESLRLPSMFVGVYAYEGTTCRKALHWKPRILDTEQEELDWGEVYAMQRVLRDYLPQYPRPKDGYYLWLNSWWAHPQLHGAIGPKESETYCNLLKQAKLAGCVDLTAIAPVWAGHAGFLVPAPAIDAVTEDAVFPMNDSIRKVVECSRELESPIWGFCEPHANCRNYRKDRPDYKLQPTRDPDQRLIQNCQANPDYVDWFYRLTCSAIDKCELHGWAWDHCWVRRPMICYDSSHGHEPGNCEFQQHRNITGMIMRLRERYPRALLEIYWGLKEAGSWGHRGLNSLENIYENNSPAPPDMSAADDMRFQHWYNHNYRFLPTYMNLAQINFGKETNGHQYSILSALSASTHGSLTDWVACDTQECADEAFAELRRWKAWASDRMAYLDDRIDLFGQPCRKAGIDGTAHCIDDHGYLFVFNPWPETYHGSVPLSARIGLTEGKRFAVDEISGEAPRRLGVYDHGAELAFAIEGKSAMLIELSETRDPLDVRVLPEDARIQPAFEP